ncbi:hypothetical protein EVG20_g841 [Dentipellis fragilis]|uniref:MIF4G domain-containing protein n=1 Tax=Dentipellis fragilis TaxID=205917 RepID=A0A4Y9ZBD8_9AGAM|nr:hypothetical protein EVG20_g841 [Dentipellis fragilis]
MSSYKIEKSTALPKPAARCSSLDHEEFDEGRPASCRVDATIYYDTTQSHGDANDTPSNPTDPGKTSSKEPLVLVDSSFPTGNCSIDTEQPVIPLKATAGRWVPRSRQRNTLVDRDSPEIVDRKVKALLNKLTVEYFESISDQIIAWANKSEKERDGRTLILVIRLVFEKATTDEATSEIYARLCKKMVEKISPKVQDDGVRDAEGKPITGGSLFRKYLFNRCQIDFECGGVQKNTPAVTATAKVTENQAIEETAKDGKDGKEENEQSSNEYYVVVQAKRRSLCLIRFMGELFKLGILTERIIHECIKMLLTNVDDPEEEEIKSLCKLLTTVGQLLDTEKARKHMDVYFSRMKHLCGSGDVNSCMQFMLQDIIELRGRKWVPREATAMKKAVRDRELFRRRVSMTPCNWRQGGNCGSGPDGWAVVGTVPSHRRAKAGDLSHFGKINQVSPMTFGPSGVFAGKKDLKAQERSTSIMDVD